MNHSMHIVMLMPYLAAAIEAAEKSLLGWLFPPVPEKRSKGFRRKAAKATKKVVGLAATAVAYSEADSAKFIGSDMSTALRAVSAGEDEDGMEEEEEEEKEEEENLRARNVLGPSTWSCTNCVWHSPMSGTSEL
jgi:hypothetical protein